mmetsp:Transcript_53882/g.65044  ORF Transcript_53882/g.65044 Transcript_53882/m.65044 type:complete len:220 (-) Transcript_53882:278-937(-)
MSVGGTVGEGFIGIPSPPEKDVFHTEHGHGSQYLLETIIILPPYQQMTKHWIQRKHSHNPPLPRQFHPPRLIQRPQREQQLKSLQQMLRARRRQKLKTIQQITPHPHTLQLQHRMRQIHPQYLRRRHRLQTLKSLVSVQSKTIPRPHPSRSSRALFRLRPRDVVEGETFHARGAGEPPLFVFSRVNDVSDGVEGDGGFGNVGGEDDFAPDGGGFGEEGG